MQALQLHTQAVLAPAKEYGVYGILDPVRMASFDPHWADMVQAGNHDFCVLGKGAEHTEYQNFMPWLVHLHEESPLTTFLCHHAGNALGVFLHASSNVMKLGSQLFPLRTVMLPSGRTVWFRFYDPRVCNVLFTTATTAQRSHLYGSYILAWFAEDLVMEQVLAYPRLPDLPKPKNSEPLQLSPQQLEDFDEAHYQYFLHSIYIELLACPRYAHTPNELHELVVAVAEWGYALGVTGTPELRRLCLALLQHSWSGAVAKALEHSVREATFPTTMLLVQHLEQQRNKLREAGHE